MNTFLSIAVLLVSALATAEAQPALRSSQRDSLACAEALDRIHGGARGTNAHAALGNLGRCRDKRAVATAVAEGIRRNRTVPDTLLMERLASYMERTTGRPVFTASMEIAADRGSSREARLAILATFFRVSNPGYFSSYYYLTGGFTSYGTPTRGCYGPMIAGAAAVPPLSRAQRGAVLSLAKRLRADASEHVDIRTLAACLGG
jgi:hypothetical protein